MSTRELKSLLLLNALLRGSTRPIYLLLHEGIEPSVLLKRIESGQFLKRQESLSQILNQFDPDKELDQCKAQGIEIITLSDSHYPELLRQIPDPPLVLYSKGRFTDADRRALAVVGSRHASLYGLTQTKKFSSAFAENGFTVVSGLARGIDQAAHEAALSVSAGRTIAVLGSGLDTVYPKENQKLFDRITKKGAVISEYPLGTKPLAMNFPRRNRIIAGLSLGILVVEAHQRSGSLITAREALDQGREVFAIPGPVDVLTSSGTNHLIQEGAYLAAHPADVLDALASSWPYCPAKEMSAKLPAASDALEESSLTTSSESPKPLDAEELPINQSMESFLKGLLAEGPLPFSEITKRAPYGPGVLALAITHLEMQKKIKKEINGCFAAVN